MSEQLLAGARSGTVVDLSQGEDVDALDVEASWGPHRQIAADLLLQILTGTISTGTTGAPPHPRGVRIRGARIVGELAWDWQHLTVPLELVDCILDCELNLEHAQIAGLSLIGCRLPGLAGEQLRSSSTLKLVGSAIAGTLFLRDATVSGAVFATGVVIGGVPNPDHGRLALLGTRMEVTGALILDAGFTAEGAVILTGARIGGNVHCSYGRFCNPHGDAIRATDAAFAGSVSLSEGFESEGRVIFDRSRIAGNLLCDGGAFVAPENEALSAIRAEIGGGLFLRDGFAAAGRTRLIGVRVGGNWDCTDGTFANPGGEDAIWASGAQIAGNVIFGGTFHIAGRLRLADAQINGTLECEGAMFANPGRTALDASNLRVSGDVWLGGTFSAKPFAAEGELRFLGARIAGSVACSGGSFSNPGKTALNLADAVIEGNVWLGTGFEADGQVRLRGMRIRGVLTCGGGTFTNPGGIALDAVDAEIGDSVFLRPDFTANGEVRLHRAQIGGTLEGNGGEFNNPGGTALFAAGVRVGAGLTLGAGFVARGSVRLALAHVTGNLTCVGGQFDDPTVAVAADGMTVTGSFRWREIVLPLLGTVELRRARVGELDDDVASWPGPDRLRIAGFSYERLSDRSPRSPRDRLEWIRRQPGYNPEPYQHLAAVYRSNGQISEATIVAIAQQDDLLARGDLTRPARAWNLFLGRSIGHGYRPARAAWALLVLYLVTLASVWLGARADAFIQIGNTAPQSSVTASRCGDAYPCLSPAAYALENITPILNLHQTENWHPKSSTPAEWILRDWLYVTTVVGYAGTTLLAAGLSGLARSA